MSLRRRVVDVYDLTSWIYLHNNEDVCFLKRCRFKSLQAPGVESGEDSRNTLNVSFTDPEATRPSWLMWEQILLDSFVHLSVSCHIAPVPVSNNELSVCAVIPAAALNTRFITLCSAVERGHS